MTDGAHRRNGAASGIDRRQLLGAALGCAALACLGVGGALAKQGSLYLRPPGTWSEDELLALCNRCGRCIQACPYHIVQPLKLGANVAASGTPVLEFKTACCDLCMDCIDACPTGALSAAAPSSRDLGVAVVVSDSCVAWNWQGCKVCVEHCPVEGALSLDAGGRPVVDAQLCNGCGMCEHVCPASSLRSYDANAAERGIYVVPRASTAARAALDAGSGELLAPLTTRALGEGRTARAAEPIPGGDHARRKLNPAVFDEEVVSHA